MIQPDAMRQFARVAELASFTQAAESLGCPKATVSATVQRLERQLGTRLLHRTTRRVQLTQDGQAFYERCKDVLADLEELEQLFLPTPAALRGRLRVDLPVGAARQLVLPRLPEFIAAHPQLEIELSCTDRRVDLVREGFDCVLRVGALGDSSLVARPLGWLRQLNLASPEYLRVHGVPQSLEDLAGHRLIHYASVLGQRSAGFEYVDAAGQACSLPMAGTLTVNNSEAYEAACLAGAGLVQVPVPGLSDLVAQGRLVELLPQFQAPPLPVSLVYAHRRQLPQRVQVFMNWLSEVLRPHLQPSP
ncbi:UNVERIFIED_ORG: LysR family transcriptional regulator [Shinella sp. XGS7]|nr:LysR family transcriptional regulator [Shinella sp. XGS7]